MLDQLTREDFASIQGRKIRLRFGDTEQEAEIIEVRDHAGGVADSRQPFSVTLSSGPADRYWPQGTHVLIHPHHGELSVFMVPIGPTDENMRYEIIFG